VYFGLSVGLQLLEVTFFNLVLLRNDFTRCTVVGAPGANYYGGGMSVYMGGYSSSFNVTGSAAAAVGDTAVRNASVRVDAVAFTSCSVNNTALGSASSGNAYGGSFSLYLGGYALSNSFGSSGGSSSTSGSTTASGVNVTISNVNTSDCSATTTGLFGANSYGGSMSVYIGAYAWSLSNRTSSSSFLLSSCGTTDVSGLVVSISSSRLINSSAVMICTFSQSPLVSISLT
jgi:hypothetical protein